MNACKPIFKIENGYCIRLANGQSWHISAMKELVPWADKFAATMQLEQCELNGYPRLIFICQNSEKDLCELSLKRPEENVAEILSGRSWNAQVICDMRFWSRPDRTDVICEIEVGDEDQDTVMMRHSLYPIYQRAQDEGAVPFHAGLVEFNKMGVLLAAPTNTGKSTCCSRIPKPWSVLCDEETLIVRNEHEQYFAHPFPTWSDYLLRRSKRTWNVQSHVHLSAIFFLEQAETDEVSPLGKGETAVLALESAMQVCHRYWSNLDDDLLRTQRKGLFDNACDLAKSIPAFKLRVSLEGRFWEEIERVLS